MNNHYTKQKTKNKPITVIAAQLILVRLGLGLVFGDGHALNPARPGPVALKPARPGLKTGPARKTCLGRDQ